jgi:hypothetical protein
MARRPFSGECSVLTGRDLPTRGEKVFTKELAQYLGVEGRVIHDLGRQRRLIKRTYRHPGREPVYYLSVYGAALVMTAVRALQGAELLDGKDYWAVREGLRLAKARAKAAVTERIRAAEQAERLREMTVCSVLFSIENPSADAEDDSRAASPRPEQEES